MKRRKRYTQYDGVWKHAEQKPDILELNDFLGWPYAICFKRVQAPKGKPITKLRGTDVRYVIYRESDMQLSPYRWYVWLYLPGAEPRNYLCTRRRHVHEVLADYREAFAK